MMEWISVKDRLPEDDPDVKKHIEESKFGFLTVLVYNGVVNQTNRFFCNESKFGLQKTEGWEWASSNVTYWMPLPKEPSEPRTNADEIRSMDDETLALFLKRVKQRTVICTVAGNSDAAENLCSLDWLKQPVKEENT